MIDGIIEGGWSFVIAAYAITWVALLIYTWSIYARGRT